MPDFMVTVRMRVAAPDIDRAIDWVEETLQEDDNVRAIESLSAYGIEEDGD